LCAAVPLLTILIVPPSVEIDKLFGENLNSLTVTVTELAPPLAALAGR
jgi:hypothetical protein